MAAPVEVTQAISALPIAKLATCSLSQWALDFQGNKERIIKSIEIAKAQGCSYRIGPELETTGYSCEDHFYEMDTIKFSCKVIVDILNSKGADDKPLTNGILCDIGMPILHNGVRYNCRVFVLNNKILLIRPKMWLADDGNYREDRWFTAWSKHKIPLLEEHILPDEVAHICNQTSANFGVAILEAADATVASEVCEELFTPESPNIMWGLEGVDIVSNGSASHFQLGKRLYRHQLIKAATARNGGVYLYSNQLGCDGNRLVFDGNSMIYKNGALLATGEHLSFQEVEVVCATINLDEVRSYRSAIVSRGIQADQRDIKAPRIKIDDFVEGFRFTQVDNTAFEYTPVIEIPMYEREEEMGLSTARYLWDYLTRSPAGGFFLPLSGGVDSGSTAMLVFYMADKLCELLNRPIVTEDDKRLSALMNNRINKNVLKNYPQHRLKDDGSGAPEKGDGHVPLTTKKLMNILLHTCNMPTKNNTALIKSFASDLATALGSFHMVAYINDAFVELKNMVGNVGFGYEPSVQPDADLSKRIDIPRYKLADGDWMENLAIQNIQARLRMLTAYYLAQILPLHRYNHNVVGDKKWAEYHAARTAVISAAKAAGEEREETDIPFAAKLTGDAKAFHDSVILGKWPAGRANNSPFLLVLASSNADEATRGFYTKYDASSADINPIGSYSKTDLRGYLQWCIARFSSADSNFRVIGDILEVVASPELTPEDTSKEEGEGIQDDEIDIGMTYADLYMFGLLRKRDNLGPLSIFQRMCKEYLGREIHVINTGAQTHFIEAATPTNIAAKVETFFKFYGQHRNKMTILTPAIHATNYSPDDNRFDQRPFLYPALTYQVAEIKKLAAEMEKRDDVKALIAKGKAVAEAVVHGEKQKDFAKKSELARTKARAEGRDENAAEEVAQLKFQGKENAKMAAAAAAAEAKAAAQAAAAAQAQVAAAVQVEPQQQRQIQLNGRNASSLPPQDVRPDASMPATPLPFGGTKPPGVYFGLGGKRSTRKHKQRYARYTRSNY
jgi:NAD+ synthase (glutamine-hydrolysing)